MNTETTPTLNGSASLITVDDALNDAAKAAMPKVNSDYLYALVNDICAGTRVWPSVITSMQIASTTVTSAATAIAALTTTTPPSVATSMSFTTATSTTPTTVTQSISVSN